MGVGKKRYERDVSLENMVNVPAQSSHFFNYFRREF